MNEYDNALEKYMDNISNTTIYKNDLLLSESVPVGDFDPNTITEIQGGIIALVGSTGFGKTFLLRELLSVVHKKYDRFYLFSGTAKLQKDYDFFTKKLPENVFQFYDDSKMAEIWNTSYEKSDKDRERILIILDDVINDPDFIKGKILHKYATGARQVKITVILLTQFLNSLKPIIRNNLRMIITFESDNFKERRKFIDEFLSIINPRVGDIIYKNITSVPFQCIVVSLYKKDKQNKIKKYLAKPVSDNQLKLVEKYKLLDHNVIKACDTVRRT